MQISKATIHRSFCDIVHLPKYFLLAWSLLKSSDTSNSYSEVTHKSSIFSSGIIGIYITMHSKESLFCQNAVLDGYYVWLTKHFVPEFNFSHFEFRINSLNLNLWLRFWRKFKGEVFQHSSIQVAALDILRIFTIVVYCWSLSAWAKHDSYALTEIAPSSSPTNNLLLVPW